MSYGPVRSGVFEAIEYVVETPGEDIPRVRTRAHYKHRGVEVAFIGRSVEDGVLLAERAEGIASVAHACAYCAALERIAGTEVPAAAQFVRVLHAELERIANHLDSASRHTEAAGQAVAYARLSLHKERVMRLRAELCGSRFGRGVVVPGGVSGPPLVGGDELLAALGELEHNIQADLELLMATPSFLDRLRGTGVLPLRIVAPRGALGPLGRASGLAEDVRISRPYGGYRHLEFAAASRDGGDALARQHVRIAEIGSSFHLLRQVVGEIAVLGGEQTTWAIPLPAMSGEGFGWAEAPQGEVLYFVRLRRRRARSGEAAVGLVPQPKPVHRIIPEGHHDRLRLHRGELRPVDRRGRWLMPWITRGTREGIVTTRYPRRPDGYGPTFRATRRWRDDSPEPQDRSSADGGDVEGVCPTRAISVDGVQVRVDHGRCIVCGRCVALRPDLFTFDPGIEVAAVHREPSRRTAGPRKDLEDLTELREDLADEYGRFVARSTSATSTADPTVQRSGRSPRSLTRSTTCSASAIYFTASPRHADLLLVTGAGAAGMLGPLQRTFEAMPSPKVVVAVGSDAASGGLFASTYATRGGVAEEIAVDVFVPGSPPSPFSILHGILLAVGLLPVRSSEPGSVGG